MLRLNQTINVTCDAGFVNVPSNLDISVNEPLAALHTGTWKDKPDVIEALWREVGAAALAGVNLTRGAMARALRAVGQEPTLLPEAHARMYVTSLLWS